MDEKEDPFILLSESPSPISLHLRSHLRLGYFNIEFVAYY